MSDLLDTSDIAGMLGLTRKYVNENVVRREGFPKPAYYVNRKVRGWDRDEVVEWIAKTSRQRSSVRR